MMSLSHWPRSRNSSTLRVTISTMVIPESVPVSHQQQHVVGRATAAGQRWSLVSAFPWTRWGGRGEPPSISLSLSALVSAMRRQVCIGILTPSFQSPPLLLYSHHMDSPPEPSRPKHIKAVTLAEVSSQGNPSCFLHPVPLASFPLEGPKPPSQNQTSVAHCLKTRERVSSEITWVSKIVSSREERRSRPNGKMKRHLGYSLPVSL